MSALRWFGRALGELARREDGGVMVLVAISGVALLAFAALAVDIGFGLTAHSEAQRVADACALAGASAYLEYEATEAVPHAESRAVEFATSNVIRNDSVQAAEVSLQVLPDEHKVRCRIQRDGLPLWFARVLGFDDLTVSADAAAQATEAGAGRCLKPFALPDLWHDADDDADGDRVWDEGEEWVLGSSPNDFYEPYGGLDGTAANSTGYGSDWRNAYDPSGVDDDYGRQLILKAPDPNSEFVPQPGVFLPWRLPEDPNQESCGTGGGGGSTGGAVYRNNICTCNESVIELGESYDIEPGNMIGPTAQGVDDLIAQDPDAYWDESTNSVVSDHGMDSPRVVRIALFDPSQITSSGMQEISFNNIALMFVEEQQSPLDPVYGRFLYFASGEGSSGPTTGSLVRNLRLVE